MRRSKKSKPKLKPSPAPRLPRVCYKFEAIGTSWTINIYESLSDIVSEQLQETIRQRIAVFDLHYSRFRGDSLISHMAINKGTFELPTDAQPMLDLYQQLYRVTDGMMTPLIGQTLSDSGYDATYSLQSGSLKSPPKWEKVLKYHFPKLELKQPALLDFGAAGKGYLVDLIGKLLQDKAVHTYCVDAGGDIVYQTASTDHIDVGLEHPDDPTLAIGVASISNQSICGSAGNRRAWGQYHHIINPVTLASPSHIKASWVVADSGLVADGLATALFFTSAERLAGHFTFEYAKINEDNSLEHSSNFPAVFFTNSESNH